ncbi:MAG: hypothetical protein ACM31C_05810 [Acidobacteriota bacterium]
MSALSRVRGRQLAAGAIGGIAGLIAMQLVQKLFSPLVRPRVHKPTDVFATERSISPLGPKHHPDEDATDAIARIAYSKVRGHEPSPKLENLLSWGVHIGYGLVAAAAYSLVRGRRSRHPVRDGVVFGTALWLAGNELAMPLLGLTDKPTAYSPSQHAQMLAAHLGYGVASTVTTRYLERAR